MITNKEWTIPDLQVNIDEWIKTIGVRYFSPLTNMAILAEEVGEVARQIARIHGEQSSKEEDTVSIDALADELADVIWVVTCLANQNGINLNDAIHRNLKKKTERDRIRHKNNPKLSN